MGSAACKVDILGSPLVLEDHTAFVSDPGAGAISTFIGVTRNNFNGKEVLRLEYECYDAMAKKKMQELCDECFKHFHVLKIAVSHRSGTVAVGEPSVIIATSSAHRLAAIEACHWLIDKIKEAVPIWKKEFYADGQVWKANAEAMPTPAQECVLRSSS